jgi:hypothetical protein
MDTLDTKDHSIVKAILSIRSSFTIPEVGDYILRLDGTLERFSYTWAEGIQTTNGKFGASFHLCSDGGASFSGGLLPAIPRDKIAPTDDSKEGAFWIFHHNEVKAHNGVHFTMPVKVWRELP